MSDQTNPTTDQPGLSLQRKIDVLEFDAASQRLAIIRLEDQMDTVNRQLKVVNWIFLALICVALSMIWFGLTK